MADNTNPKQQEEEIDLGQFMEVLAYICKQTGKFFVWIFKGIGKLLLALLDFFIFFFRKYRLIFILCFAALSGVWLYVLFQSKEGLKLVYKSSASIEIKYNSGAAVSTVISYINSAIKNGEIKFLAENFGISQSQAASLKQITIVPTISDATNLEYYHDMFMGSDTAILKRIGTYSKNIIENLGSVSNINYPYQEITVYSTDNTIFQNLTANLIDMIENESAIQNIKNRNIDILDLNKKSILEGMATVDSILAKYAKKQPSPQENASIYIGEKDKESAEVSLTGRKIALRNDLLNIEIKEINKDKVIVLTSNFNYVGEVYKNIPKQIIEKMLQIALISMLISLAFHFALYSCKFIGRRAKTIKN